jgi:hypothetical protein
MGDYTLKETLLLTYRLYRNRFIYKKRDVVKKINIKEIDVIDRKEKNKSGLLKKYLIESKSFPKYRPYIKKSDKSILVSFKRVAHMYDVVFEFDELSLETKNWYSRVGSGKKWIKKPPQKFIKKLYPETKEKFMKKAKDIELRSKGKRKAKNEYIKMIKSHQRLARYLDIGDYNSRVRGLNGDWIFRCDYAYFIHNHRFGKNYFGNKPAKITNPKNYVFFGKHQLNIIEKLLIMGILK